MVRCLWLCTLSRHKLLRLLHHSTACLWQAALSMVLFRKALRLSLTARSSAGVGSILTLVANDTYQVSELLYWTTQLLNAPWQVGAAHFVVLPALQ